MKGLAGRGAKGTRYQLYRIILDRLEFLDQGDLFAFEPELAPVCEDW